MMVAGSRMGSSQPEPMTSYQLCVFALVAQYLEMLRCAKYSGCSHNCCFNGREKRAFLLTVFNLVQRKDCSLKELISFCHEMHNKRELLDKVFTVILPGIADTKTIDFLHYVQRAKSFFYDRHPFCVSFKDSICGMFVRKCLVFVDCSRFDEISTFISQFERYYDDYKASQVVPCSDVSLEVADLNLGELAAEERIEMQTGDDRSKKTNSLQCIKSHSHGTRAFLAQQIWLLEHNEKEALEPEALQSTLESIRVGNYSTRVKSLALFLSVLNCLRVRDLSGAIHMSRYLRGVDAHDFTSSRVEDTRTHLLSVLLHSAILGFFDFKEQACAFLNEAMNSMNVAADQPMLSRALRWLVKVKPNDLRCLSTLRSIYDDGQFLTDPLMKSGCVVDICKEYVNQASSPHKSFELLEQSSFGSVHQNVSHVSTYVATQSALWQLYGHRPLSVLSSQSLLLLDTQVDGIFHWAEAETEAVCILAVHHAHMGQWSVCKSLLELGRSQLSQISSLHKRIDETDRLVGCYNAFMTGQLRTVRENLKVLQVLDSDEALFCELRLLIASNETGKALALLESKSNSPHLTPYIKLRLQLAEGVTLIKAGGAPRALTTLSQCYDDAVSLGFLSIQLSTSVLLAHIHLELGLGDIAANELQRHLTLIPLAPCLLRACAMLTMARAFLSSSTPTGRVSALYESVDLAKSAYNIAHQLQCHLLFADSAIFLANAYDELGLVPERNVCASKAQSALAATEQSDLDYVLDSTILTSILLPI